MKVIRELELTREDEIVRLHNQIGGYLKASFENAIRIGELLVEQKMSLPHGEFTVWVNENLPFTDRTARSYMMVYRERDLLKTENVSVLSEGYKLLTQRAAEMAGVDDYDALYSKAQIVIGEMKAMLDKPDVSINELTEIQDRALRIQNFFAERHIRAEREIGKILNELNVNTIQEAEALFSNAKVTA